MGICGACWRDDCEVGLWGRTVGRTVREDCEVGLQRFYLDHEKPQHGHHGSHEGSSLAGNTNRLRRMFPQQINEHAHEGSKTAVEVDEAAMADKQTSTYFYAGACWCQRK